MDELPTNQPESSNQPNSPIQQPTPQQTQYSTSVNPTPDDEQEPKTAKEGGILSFFGALVVALILVQVINIFFFQSYKVVGSSMYPTLHDGDRLVISKISKSLTRVTKGSYQPKRGDVIVFDSPREQGLQLIKRVIGLPGERVVVKDGEITVYNTENPNGFNPDENTKYEDGLPETSGNTDIRVPEGHIFVSGDNREGGNSLDSRNELGTVPTDLITGTLRLRLWPIDSARFF